MNRRYFSKASLALISTAAASVSGCHGPEDAPPSISIPPFSRTALHAQLEALRLAFEAKGQHVTEALLPPIAEESLREKCTWFPAELPEELIALYAWRGGQAKETTEEKYPFWFRDCGFINPESAAQEYQSMMSAYGPNPMDHELLKHSFPFAAFNGGWLVFPCKGQSIDKRVARPVISVFQGVDVFFYSMQIMIDTCLEWVSHRQYEENAHLPQDVELQIWRKHNPGIFPGAR